MELIGQRGQYRVRDIRVDDGSALAHGGHDVDRGIQCRRADDRIRGGQHLLPQWQFGQPLGRLFRLTVCPSPEGGAGGRECAARGRDRQVRQQDSPGDAVGDQMVQHQPAQWIGARPLDQHEARDGTRLGIEQIRRLL